MGLEEREALRLNRPAVEPPPERPPKTYGWIWFVLLVVAAFVWLWLKD